MKINEAGMAAKFRSAGAIPTLVVEGQESFKSSIKLGRQRDRAKAETVLVL